MADMRPYAERLAKAMPERFEFTVRARGNWMIEPIRTPDARYWVNLWNEAADYHAWAFWGPLADELKVRPHGVDEEGKPGTLAYDPLSSWLESIAEAVCQEAERRGNRTLESPCVTS